MLPRNRSLAICLIAAPVALATPALGQQGPKASFDCAKARTPVERAICDGNYTAELDLVMAELYRAVTGKAEPQKRAAIEASQRKWLAARDTRCGRAKPDTECLGRLYKDRIVELSREWRALGGTAQGTSISGRYVYREKGNAGEMLLAEMPDGAVYLQTETVNTNHPSPHTCSFSGRLKTRSADVLQYREPESSKTCGLQVSVAGNRATLSEMPKECFELAQYYCGAHGYMLGNYVRR